MRAYAKEYVSDVVENQGKLFDLFKDLLVLVDAYNDLIAKTFVFHGEASPLCMCLCAAFCRERARQTGSYLLLFILFNDN